jgi:threonine dehydratase
MPVNTPNQKIKKIKLLGGDCIEVFLNGDTYDDCAKAALLYSQENELTLIPPFDDELIIEGQATVGNEILMDLNEIDYLFIPVGGGGLAAGLGKYFQQYSSNTKLIGVEPTGAASMTAAFNAGKPVKLKKINPFVDGAAVRKVGNLNYAICIETLYQVITVDEGEICATIISLYDEDGIVAEPAGALSIAALADFTNEIRGKKVVCILSGGNNDSNRIEEIKKLAEEWQELQHCLNDTIQS